MKSKFKVGDRVGLTDAAMMIFFPNGTKFRKGVVTEVTGHEVKVVRDHDGIIYRGHESKWWMEEYWKKIK